MPSVITLMPNPGIDVSTVMQSVIVGKKLYCTDVKKEPRGGGIVFAIGILPGHWRTKD